MLLIVTSDCTLTFDLAILNFLYIALLYNYTSLSIIKLYIHQSIKYVLKLTTTKLA